MVLKLPFLKLTILRQQ